MPNQASERRAQNLRALSDKKALKDKRKQEITSKSVSMAYPKEPFEDQPRRRLKRKASLEVDGSGTPKKAKLAEAAKVKQPKKRAAGMEEVEEKPSKRQKILGRKGMAPKKVIVKPEPTYFSWLLKPGTEVRKPPPLKIRREFIQENVEKVEKVKPKELTKRKPAQTAPPAPTAPKLPALKLPAPKRPARQGLVQTKAPLKVHAPRVFLPSPLKSGTESVKKVSAVIPNSGRRSSQPEIQKTAAPATKKRSAEEMERPAKKLKRTPRGLFNDGNSCFINSTVQCLAGELAAEYRPLKRNILPAHSNLEGSNAATASRELKTRKGGLAKSSLKAGFAEASKDDISLGAYFGHVLDDLTSKRGEDKAASSFLFAQAYGRFRPEYDGSAEQDPSDFLEDLLTRLKEEHDITETIRESASTDLDTFQRKLSGVESIYEGQIATKVSCRVQDCKYEEETVNNFWTLRIGVPPESRNLTVTDCLKEVMSLEKDRSWCEKCGRKGGRITTTYLKYAPPHLLMQLCRATLNGKDFTKVDLPTGSVDLSVCQQGSIPGDPAGSSYQMTGVVKHIGKGINSGHYIAFVKKHSQWWKFDDNRVTAVDSKAVNEDASGQACLLFFKRP